MLKACAWPGSLAGSGRSSELSSADTSISAEQPVAKAGGGNAVERTGAAGQQLKTLDMQEDFQQIACSAVSCSCMLHRLAGCSLHEQQSASALFPGPAGDLLNENGILAAR